jgi:radical SAM enzyme (TIGR01210 family)
VATIPYPETARERSDWILARRRETNAAARDRLDPFIPSAYLREEERNESGEIVPVTTVFLTNTECPWRCLMCDLWQNTVTEAVPPGAIPAQIEYALERTEAAREIKLYNSGSFFDRRAIPVGDYASIAARLRPFEKVVVESHPSLVAEDCLRFRDHIDGRLEVAMGLETVDPSVLPRLNKRMTLDLFSDAANVLRDSDIALRVFILVKPPFTTEDGALEWALRSLDFAFDCGATAAVLIPTRAGNGAMEALADQGLFSPPRLSTLERALENGIALERGRVFADLWNLELLASCDRCFETRRDRLHMMNLTQQVYRGIECPQCEEGKAYEV